jgi:hypothetical protein
MLSEILRTLLVRCPPWARRLALRVPIPEWNPDFYRVHEIGVWIDGP